MKLFFLILIALILVSPTFAQEVSIQETRPRHEALFPDDLYVELLNSIRKRYENKDISTLKLRKKELDKILRHRSNLDSKTRQRLEIEWVVIQENLYSPLPIQNR